MKEQWRKELQDKMADYQQPAPLLSWDELEQAVAAQQRPAKKVVFYRQRWIAVAAVGILCVGVAVSLLWNPAHLNPQQSSIQTSVGPEKQGAQLSAKTEKQLLSDSQPLLASLSEHHSQKAERLPKESRRILTTDERVDVENTEQSSLAVAATDETTAKAVTETTETIAATASNPTDEQTQPVTSKTNRPRLPMYLDVSGRHLNISHIPMATMLMVTANVSRRRHSSPTDSLMMATKGENLSCTTQRHLLILRFLGRKVQIYYDLSNWLRLHQRNTINTTSHCALEYLCAIISTIGGVSRQDSHTLALRQISPERACIMFNRWSRNCTIWESRFMSTIRCGITDACTSMPKQAAQSRKWLVDADAPHQTPTVKATPCPVKKLPYVHSNCQ